MRKQRVERKADISEPFWAKSLAQPFSKEGASLFYANHGIQGSKVRDFRRREASSGGRQSHAEVPGLRKLNVGQG